jgi:hypothetical protein
MTAAVARPLFTRNTWTASHAEPAAVQTLMEVSVRRLAALLDENGEDDFGKIGPTQVAFKNALIMVVAAITILGKDVPSSPVVDSEGGIRVSWRHGDKHVKLVCPATNESAVYIYHASSAGNGIRNQNVTPAALAERLAWLTQRERAAAG